MRPLRALTKSSGKVVYDKGEKARVRMYIESDTLEGARSAPIIDPKRLARRAARCPIRDDIPMPGTNLHRYWAWPGPAMFGLNRRLREQGLLQSKQSSHDWRGRTLEPGVYAASAVPYESAMLVLVSNFLGRRLHSDGKTSEPVLVI